MFNRSFFAAAILLSCTPLAHATLKWDKTTVFVASAPSGAPATTDFSFTNTGSYPVKIHSAVTSCGCTAAVVEQRVFAPGETGKIHVSFKTLNRRGLYEEPILVETDDAAKQVTLTLRVLVKDAIELQPAFLFWGQGETLSSKSLTVTVTDGYAVKGISAQPTDPRLDVQVATVRPGAEYKVTITPKSARVRASVAITPQFGGGQPPKTFTAHVRVI